MKKSLLTLGFVAAVAAGASAQGVLGIFNASSAGFNTATSNPLSATGWYTGNLTLSIYTFAASAANTVSTINADELAAGSVGAGVTLAETGTLQQVSPSGGGTEAASQILNIGGGLIASTSQGDYTVGTSGTLPSGTGAANVYYALVFTGGTGGVEGAVVLDLASPGNSQTPQSSTVIWPVNQQNVLLEPVPEPATLALAGLGGLSMLFLRRRNS